MSQQLTIQSSIAFLLFIVLATPSPAFAYGDPSGGLFFQTLTPLVAVLWGAWMIFAGAIRKTFRKVVNRIRGAVPEEIVSNAEQNVQPIETHSSQPAVER